MAKPKKSKESEGTQAENIAIEEKRNELINILQPKLLTNAQLRKGGAGIVGRNSAEAGYQANIDEINKLGRQLGLADVSLGSLRK